MKKFVALVGMLVVFAGSSGAWADLYSGSLSTPLLYDSSSYPVQPYSARTPIANAPGGLAATAAWDQYGMKLDWHVTDNGNGTYTYNYKFGPGWYPPSQPTSGSTDDPYVTNKEILAWDIQLGASLTMADISNAAWNIYQYDGSKIGSGTATTWTSYDPATGAVLSSSSDYSSAFTLLKIGDLKGLTGTGQPASGHTANNLFYGLQWVMPIDPDLNLAIWNTDTSFDLTFTSTFAPGLGNFFANSSRTKANQNYTDVVAFDGTFDATGKSIATWANSVTVAGGAAPVPIPPAVFLFGSGLSGLFFLRRKKIEG
jgi:hypothetical protein